MTARRIAELAALILLFVAALYALPMKAQDFRIADQIYLPSAIHIPPWTTDVTITNETDDPVRVTVDLWPANSTPMKVQSAVVIHLAPRESRYVADVLGFLGLSGMGQVKFNGCLEGADCTPDPTTDLNPNYRNISVESRTYLRTANGGTFGQDMPGLAWWDYGDRNYPLKVVGVRVGPQYHTNFGIVNTSQYAGVWLWATLYDGPSHAVRDRVHVHLRPMEALQKPLTDLFPLLGDWSRLNRTRSTNSAYVTVEMDSVEPVVSGVPAGCYDSCAAFLAYGSLIDNVSGAATTLEATFGGEGGALNAAQVYGMFSKSSEVAAALGGTSGFTQAAKATLVSMALPSRPATSEVAPFCIVEQIGPYEYRVERYDSRTEEFSPITGKVRSLTPQWRIWTKVGPPRLADDPNGEMTMAQIAREAERARTMCGAMRTGGAQ